MIILFIWNVRYFQIINIPESIELRHKYICIIKNHILILSVFQINYTLVGLNVKQVSCNPLICA